MRNDFRGALRIKCRTGLYIAACTLHNAETITSHQSRRSVCLAIGIADVISLNASCTCKRLNSLPSARSFAAVGSGDASLEAWPSVRGRRAGSAYRISSSQRRADLIGNRSALPISQGCAVDSFIALPCLDMHLRDTVKLQHAMLAFDRPSQYIYTWQLETIYGAQPHRWRTTLEFRSLVRVHGMVEPLRAVHTEQSVFRATVP